MMIIIAMDTPEDRKNIHFLVNNADLDKELMAELKKALASLETAVLGSAVTFSFTVGSASEKRRGPVVNNPRDS